MAHVINSQLTTCESVGVGLQRMLRAKRAESFLFVLFLFVYQLVWRLALRRIELRRHIETLTDSSSHKQAHTQTMLTLGASVAESLEHARIRVIY